MLIVKSESRRAAFKFKLLGCNTVLSIISTDQVSKRVYYTKDYDRTNSGVVKFRDARTRADVTPETSEIIEISRQQDDAGLEP
jgi:hypothetical protein